MSNLWKFTDPSNRVVSRLNQDGSCASCSIGAIADWIAEGNTPEPAKIPATAQIIVQYEAALDAHLDSVAQEHRFKDRHSLSLRAGYPNAWQALGVAFGSWMDGCNVQAYALLQDVLDGNAQMPTIGGFLSSLPEFVAP